MRKEIALDRVPVEAVGEYEGMVRSLAYKLSVNLSNLAFDMDDLLQEGRIAVWEALQDYDPSVGAKRSGLVYRYILQRMLNVKSHALTKKRRHVVACDLNAETYKALRCVSDVFAGELEESIRRRLDDFEHAVLTARLEDKTIGQIAREHNTYNQRVVKAIKKIREVASMEYKVRKKVG